jgi:ABC-type branched-subunit amino acid transport system substrate-binding protein
MSVRQGSASSALRNKGGTLAGQNDSTRIVRRRRSRGKHVVAVLAAAGLVLAACGDDDDSSSGDAATTTEAASSGDAATTTEAASSGDAATTAGETGNTTRGTGGPAPTGEPIRVMTEAPVDSQVAPYPNIPEAAKVYAQWINDRGGIKGRPLQVDICDDQADAAKAADCARQAVENGDVANVGSFTVDASRGIPILEENKIAWFGACCPIQANEFTSPISFPMGFVSAFPTAAAIKMIDDGCKNVVQIYGDLPASQVFVDAFSNGWKAKGKDPSGLKVVLIPLEPGDYSSQAAQANDPPVDCLFGNISEVNWPPLITALDGVGATPRLYGPQGNLNSKVAEQFPEQTNGGIVVDVYPGISAPVWDEYRAALEEYNAPDLDWNSLAGLGTWAAFTAFTQIVEGMTGEINNETFLEAASKADNIDTGGMVGVLDFTKEWDGGGGKFNRIFNRTVFFDVIKDGKLEPLNSTAYDMTDAFDGKPTDVVIE